LHYQSNETIIETVETVETNHICRQGERQILRLSTGDKKWAWRGSDKKKIVYCLNGTSICLRHKYSVAPLFVYSHDTDPELETITAYHYR